MATLECANKASANAVIDPVCRMEVIPGLTRLATIYQGRGYWFCCEDCLSTFEMNPKKYLDAKRKKRKGWFGRYLDRMAKINKQQFGAAGPQCH